MNLAHRPTVWPNGATDTSRVRPYTFRRTRVVGDRAVCGCGPSPLRASSISNQSWSPAGTRRALSPNDRRGRLAMRREMVRGAMGSTWHTVRKHQQPGIEVYRSPRPVSIALPATVKNEIPICPHGRRDLRSSLKSGLLHSRGLTSLLPACRRASRQAARQSARATSH